VRQQHRDPSAKYDQSIIEHLKRGEIISCKLAPNGSNYTFFVQVHQNDQTSLAIYKPKDGESPLWDFPSGTLYKREYAAYMLDRALGWNFIPHTVIRDGPYGVGIIQEYLPHDPRLNYYTLTKVNAAELQMIACFDLVGNNADRKAAHVLVDSIGKLWSIDHGLTFHATTKIRTVIWDFCGDPIPDYLLASLSDLYEQLANPSGFLKDLLDMLHPMEVKAFEQRINWVLTNRIYPGVPSQHQQYS
jgi:uncharacterized repeat protein (TIGR03843 family)